MSRDNETYISAKISEYAMPPLKDLLILGKDAPIGCIAMKRALDLLVKTPYEHIEIDDDVISDILVRQSLMRRLSKEQLINFVLKQAKSLLGSEEILHAELTVDIHITSRK